jgi:predicted transcriptional regulator
MATTNKLSKKTQIRILQTLAKSKLPITRQGIATKADINPAMTYALGSDDDKKRAKNDKQYGKSLVTRGYTKCTANDEGSKYTITTAGKKALAAAK